MVHLALNGVETNLAGQVTAQVGVGSTNLQSLKCLAGVHGQRRVKITALGVEGGNAAAWCAPLHPHGGRGGTIPVGRLICFRSGSDTRSTILPVRFTQLNRLEEIVLQLNRISQHPEVHGVAVKGTPLAADVETVTPRIRDGHVGQDQCIAGRAGDVDPVFKPLVIERPVPRHRSGERYRGSLVNLLQFVQIADARRQQHLHHGLSA